MSCPSQPPCTRAKVVLAAIRIKMPSIRTADSEINDNRFRANPAGLRATSIAEPTSAAAASAISAQPLAVGGTSSYCQIESQAEADSLVQSDHNPQITVNVASVLSPTIKAAHQLIRPSALFRFCPRFISQSEFTTTSPARIDQN